MNPWWRLMNAMEDHRTDELADVVALHLNYWKYSGHASVQKNRTGLCFTDPNLVIVRGAALDAAPNFWFGELNTMSIYPDSEIVVSGMFIFGNTYSGPGDLFFSGHDSSRCYERAEYVLDFAGTHVFYLFTEDNADWLCAMMIRNMEECGLL